MTFFLTDVWGSFFIITAEHMTRSLWSIHAFLSFLRRILFLWIDSGVCLVNRHTVNTEAWETHTHTNARTHNPRQDSPKAWWGLYHFNTINLEKFDLKDESENQRALCPSPVHSFHRNNVSKQLRVSQQTAFIHIGTDSPHKFPSLVHTHFKWHLKSNTEKQCHQRGLVVCVI